MELIGILKAWRLHQCKLGSRPLDTGQRPEHGGAELAMRRWIASGFADYVNKGIPVCTGRHRLLRIRFVAPIIREISSEETSLSDRGQ